MLLGGDEFGRTQGGNNNAWCQDSEISWFDWDLGPEQQELLDFTRRLIRLRREHPVFHRSSFLAGEEIEGSGLPDAWWFRPDGERMTPDDWRSGHPVLGLFLNGEEIPYKTRSGGRIVDDSFLLLVNGFHEDVTFHLPGETFGERWEADIATGAGVDVGEGFSAGADVPVQSRSMVVLRRV
jgi:glycogen operon protein